MLSGARRPGPDGCPISVTNDCRDGLAAGAGEARAALAGARLRRSRLAYERATIVMPAPLARSNVQCRAPNGEFTFPFAAAAAAAPEAVPGLPSHSPVGRARARAAPGDTRRLRSATPPFGPPPQPGRSTLAARRAPKVATFASPACQLENMSPLKPASAAGRRQMFAPDPSDWRRAPHRPAPSQRPEQAALSAHICALYHLARSCLRSN